MSFRPLFTRNAPPPNGSYAQGVHLGMTIHCAGFFGDLPETGMLAEGGVAGQTAQIVKNVEAVLKEGGSDLSKIGTHGYAGAVFLLDMKDLKAVNEEWDKHFAKGTQASTAVQVSALAKPGALVEIECIAMA